VNVAEYLRMYGAEERQWWYAGMRAISLRLLRPALRPGPIRSLDAGCGTGRNVQLLESFGPAFGLDLSPEAMAFARERRIRVVRGSVLDLPFGGETFDVVTSFDVLYHRWVTDDAAAVRELARVLRPGGLLLVRVPALRMLWGAHDEAVHSRHRYTRREVEALLQGAGLALVRATYANSVLFPLLLARRTLDRLLRRSGSDVGFLPGPLEAVFGAALALEARLVGHLSLPVGASVLALGRKATSGPAGTIARR
jgi:SAM-dependent methyltransferase